MVEVPKTAEEAYAAFAGSAGFQGVPEGVPIGYASPFICPYCEVNSQHHWGVAINLSVYPQPGTASNRRFGGRPLVAAECQNCSNETIFENGLVVVPDQSGAPRAADDMPKEVADDFEEARTIVSRSPRGAAALLRLVIQKLCPILGATKTDINAAIGELVAMGKVSPALQQALDTVRVVGNESVHPGTLDLKDDRITATALFGLVNFIVEKAITEPKQVKQLYSTLPPGKIAGITSRDQTKQNPAPASKA